MTCRLRLKVTFWQLNKLNEIGDELSDREISKKGGDSDSGRNEEAGNSDSPN